MPYPQARSPRPPDIPAEAPSSKPPDLDAMGKPMAHMSAAPDTLDQALSWLPTAGAVAGGALGSGLMSIPLAALGGAGGRGLETTIKTMRHGLQPESKSAMSGANDLLDTGIQQGGLEAAGQGLLKVAEPIARPVGNFLMDQAVRPAKGLVKEFPKVIDTIMDEGLKVGRMLPFGKKGSEVATAARAGSAANTEGVLGEAGRAGYRVDPTQLLSGVTRLRQKLSAKPIANQTLGSIDSMTGQYLKEHTKPVLGMMDEPLTMGQQMSGAPARRVMGETGRRTPRLMTPLEAKQMKQVAQAEGAPIFRAERAGSVIPTADKLEARVEQHIGKDTKAALESIPEYGDRIKASETRTQNLIGAEKAIKDAEGNRMSFTAWEPRNAIALGLGGGAGYASGDPGTALETILASRALMSPTVLSRLVQAAKSRPAKMGVRLLPRVGALLNESTQ